jgi:inhibitor of cysteine peptidase
MRVSVGQVFTIALSENPTTGYRWDAKFDGQFLKLEETRFEADIPESIGSGGTEIFKFIAIKPGKTEILVHYRRPWEKRIIEEKMFSIIIT